jgi:hypothetical protein
LAVDGPGHSGKQVSFVSAGAQNRLSRTFGDGPS